jgi:hypothetical protein
MKNRSASRPTRVRPVLAAACVLLLACVLAGATLARSTVMSHLTAIGFVAPALTYRSPQGRPDSVVSVLVTSTGFPDDEISVGPGLHHLLLINRTGLDGLTFVVTRPGQDALLTGGGEYIEGDIPFAPGEVLITEASHPEWICRISVTP